MPRVIIIFNVKFVSFILIVHGNLKVWVNKNPDVIYVYLLYSKTAEWNVAVSTTANVKRKYVVCPPFYVVRFFMPRLTKVSGAYSVCRVCPSVCVSVCTSHFFKTLRRRNWGARFWFLCPAWLKSAGHIVFALSVRPSVRLSVCLSVRVYVPLFVDTTPPKL